MFEVNSRLWDISSLAFSCVACLRNRQLPRAWGVVAASARYKNAVLGYQPSGQRRVDV
jgi:hypothetical protein